MPVMSDTTIRRWYTTAGDNGPSDGEFIGRNLGRQWRNIKSIARAESLDKEFEKTAYTAATSSSGGSGSGTITVAGEGDLSTTFTTLRKLRLTPPNGDAIYVAVDATSYSGGSDTNTVTVIELTDTIGTNVAYEIDLGVVNPDASCLPAVHESGQVTISGTDTFATAGFSEAAQRDEDLVYFVKTQIVSCTGSSPADHVTKIVKSFASMEIHIKAAPGATKSTVIDWQVFRSMP